MSTSIFIFAFSLGLIVALAVWLALSPLVSLVGATGDTHDLAVEFLSILIPSLPVMMVSMSASSVLRAHGDAKRAMSATLLTGVTNAIFDPIFIFGFGMKLRGAALASVIGRLTMCSYLIFILRRHHFRSGFVRITPAQFATDVRAISRIALPAVLTNVATPIGGAYVTSQMAQYGEEAVSGMAMVSRLQPVAFAVVFSLSGAMGPIIGQNYGAKMYERVQGAYRAGLLFTLGYICFATLFLFAIRYPLAKVFGAKPGGVAEQLLYLFCGPLALAWFFNGVSE